MQLYSSKGIMSTESFIKILKFTFTAGIKINQVGGVVINIG